MSFDNVTTDRENIPHFKRQCKNCPVMVFHDNQFTAPVDWFTVINRNEEMDFCGFKCQRDYLALREVGLERAEHEEVINA